MNGIQEKQLNTEAVSEVQRKKAEERRRIAQRRRVAEKRRQKRRIKLILLAMCMVIVIACAVVIAVLPASYDESQEITASNSGSVSVNEEDTDIPSDSKLNKKNMKDTEKNLFGKVEYYKEANEERYKEYFKENPDMSVEDIVWRVNANLDMPMYEFDVPVSGYDDTYIIVNKYYTVSQGYEPPDMKEFDGHLLREETGIAFERMQEDALAEGYNINIVAGYRSFEEQSELYNGYLSTDSEENVDRYTQRPGHSEHHTGMAMDISGTDCNELLDFVNSPEYPWVMDNCYKYGFIIRYPEGTEDITGYEFKPWHLRYVGVEVSTDMKEKNIKSYEEYYAKYLG